MLAIKQHPFLSKGNLHKYVVIHKQISTLQKEDYLDT